jgi:hypothetical protein
VTNDHDVLFHVIESTKGARCCGRLKNLDI